jgi:hypothetical protein
MNCPRCDKPIDEHEAGPETDACVAVVVMGSNKPVYKHSAPHIDPIFDKRDGYWMCYPEYEEGDVCKWEAIPFSTTINNAWKVVEKIAKTNYVDIGVDKHGGQVQIDAFVDGSWELGFVESTAAETTELAICRTALKWQSSKS